MARQCNRDAPGSVSFNMRNVANDIESRAGATIRYRRHSLVVRITHWINVICMTLLLFSGLQIFNAHPALYWGSISTFDDPILAMRREQGADGSFIGITEIGDTRFETTGFLGASWNEQGNLESRGFPSWLTVPSYRDLASGRRWHFFFAWALVINGAVYVAYTLASGHWRQMVPTGRQLRDIGGSLRDHLMLRFPEGEAAKSYNVLQRLAYFGVIVIVVPALILAGLTMSPGMNAAFPWLLDLFGGRQSARTIHFIAAGLLLLFVLVHVLMVILSGPINNMRSMITGIFAIDREKER